MQPDCKLRNATAKTALCCFPYSLHDVNIATTELTCQQFSATHEPGNRHNEILKQCLAWPSMSCSRRTSDRYPATAVGHAVLLV